MDFSKSAAPIPVSCRGAALLRPFWSKSMRLGNNRFSLFFCIALFLLIPFASFSSHAQRKAPPDPARPKIRAITAFINLDRTQYQQQVPAAITMPNLAPTIFLSPDYEVETIHISK